MIWRDAIDALLVDVFLEAQASPPEQIVLDIEPRMWRFTGSRRNALITATTITTAICAPQGPARTLKDTRAIARQFK